MQTLPRRYFSQWLYVGDISGGLESAAALVRWILYAYSRGIGT